MIDYLEMVKEFHVKYGHYMGTLDCIPSIDIINLRHKLITEEAQEFYDASDQLDISTYGGGTNKTPEECQVLIADAIADLLYVTFGAALAYGIPIEEVFKEVHRSNMTKSMLKDEKSIKGKTIKGPDYEPPDIKKVLGL